MRAADRHTGASGAAAVVWVGFVLLSGACNEIIGADEPTLRDGQLCGFGDICSNDAPCIDFVCACRRDGALCGSGCRRQCISGETCVVDDDCISNNVCHETAEDGIRRCMPIGCASHGYCGLACGLCENGGPCSADNDCLSNACDSVHLTCADPNCIVDASTSYCGPNCSPFCTFEECDSHCTTGNCQATTDFPCDGPGSKCACL